MFRHRQEFELDSKFVCDCKLVCDCEFGCHCKFGCHWRPVRQSASVLNRHLPKSCP